ncbi:MAG: L-threonylcarbamoyladenylate synthase [Pseudomonadota bacterium]|nr:L-threonylcarbamoyladenylate synthase [Pseudomonadota bacterium]
MTKIKKINNKTINEAVELLQKGKLIGFPTETVYGLGADATNQKAILKIYKNKQRPKSNPLIVHTETIEQACSIGVFNSKIEKIAKDIWPGPLTVIVKKRENSIIRKELCAGNDTIAIRVSSNKTILAIIKKLGNPIAAPSANKSGMLSPTSAAHVEKQFKNNTDIPLILDGGKTKIGVESTVIGMKKNNIIIYRHGGVTKEKLEKKVNEKIIDLTNADFSKKSNISPGMLKKHYSPTVPLRINITNPRSDEILIGFGEKYEEPNLSKSGDLDEAAANLFYFLEKYEAKGNKIAIAPIPNIGIGVAINDRLNRAVQ